MTNEYDVHIPQLTLCVTYYPENCNELIGSGLVFIKYYFGGSNIFLL